MASVCRNHGFYCTSSVCCIHFNLDLIFLLCSLFHVLIHFTTGHLISSQLFLISPCSVLSLLAGLCSSFCFESSMPRILSSYSCSVAGFCSTSVRLRLFVQSYRFQSVFLNSPNSWLQEVFAELFGILYSLPHFAVYNCIIFLYSSTSIHSLSSGMGSRMPFLEVMSCRYYSPLSITHLNAI
jgi:hypothetical protein